MPIARIDDRLVHFAHVPKCAGTAVEEYMAARFGPLAFLDRSHRSHPWQTWSRTSPQHVEAAALAQLFPPGFFAASFAVVRHPAVRLLSSYGYERRRARVPPGRDFFAWLRWQSRKRARDPHALDNHVRPMADIVPEAAVVFRLEDGLDRVVEWLDAVTGDKAGPRTIAAVHATETIPQRPRRRRARLLGRLLDRPVPVLDEAICRAVHAAYRQDYDRFGYGVLDPLSEKDTT